MFRNKLKETLKQETDNKKKIENLVFLIIVIIITVIVINIILDNGNNEATNQENTTTKTKKLASSLGIANDETIQTNSSNNDLKKELEDILMKIQGVKDVKVFINYSQSSETIAMYNENTKKSQTEETDTSGGIRKIEENDTQKEVVYQEDNGEKIPITQKIVNPKVEGAIVTAKGAQDANVKTSIIQAVEAATGLPTHKIQVFEMN